MREEANTSGTVIRLDGLPAGEESQEAEEAHTVLEAISKSLALPPMLSARDRLSRWQWETLGGLIVAAAAGLLLFPVWITVGVKVVFWLLFSMTVFWRLALTIIGVLERLKPDARARSRSQQDEAVGPVYSILIALRHEANMMDQLAGQLHALDWPKRRLEVLLLVEADDEETRLAIERTRFPAGTRCLTVPPGSPMTKPRALNYGLAHARGDYITVYDAEDRPHPQQLKIAAERFESSRPGLTCVQAPLVCTNGASGWLPAQWSLEYAVQFGLHMPALASLEFPVMLGGTSNHFRGLM